MDCTITALLISLPTLLLAGFTYYIYHRSQKSIIASFSSTIPFKLFIGGLILVVATDLGMVACDIFQVTDKHSIIKVAVAIMGIAELMMATLIPAGFNFKKEGLPTFNSLLAAMGLVLVVTIVMGTPYYFSVGPDGGIVIKQMPTPPNIIITPIPHNTPNIPIPTFNLK